MSTECLQSMLVAADSAEPRHSEASLVQLNGNDLLLGWSAFSSQPPKASLHQTVSTREMALARDDQPAEIRAIESSDHGASWSQPRVLVANDAGINVMQPAFANLPDGNLGLAYSWRGSQTRARRMFMRSNDAGQTWSTAVPVVEAPGYWTGAHDRLLVLANGRLLLPCQHKIGSHLSTIVAMSDDCGRTWRTGSPVQLPVHVGKMI